jgi:hypothetical protein
MSNTHLLKSSPADDCRIRHGFKSHIQSKGPADNSAFLLHTTAESMELYFVQADSVCIVVLMKEIHA